MAQVLMVVAHRGGPVVQNEEICKWVMNQNVQSYKRNRNLNHNDVNKINENLYNLDSDDASLKYCCHIYSVL